MSSPSILRSNRVTAVQKTALCEWRGVKDSRLGPIRADQGTSFGANSLGLCFERGLGVPIDLTEAVSHPLPIKGIRLFRSTMRDGWNAAFVSQLALVKAAADIITREIHGAHFSKEIRVVRWSLPAGNSFPSRKSLEFTGNSKTKAPTKPSDVTRAVLHKSRKDLPIENLLELPIIFIFVRSLVFRCLL
jgi:hypothetical protein